jgi:hypothetical protein
VLYPEPTGCHLTLGRIFSPSIILKSPPIKVCSENTVVLYKICVFCVNQKSKMAAIAVHSFNVGPYGKISKKSQKLWIWCTSKLYANNLWIVPYNFFFFVSKLKRNPRWLPPQDKFSIYSTLWGKYLKEIHIRNYKTIWWQAKLKCSLDCLYQVSVVFFVCRS